MKPTRRQALTAIPGLLAFAALPRFATARGGPRPHPAAAPRTSEFLTAVARGDLASVRRLLEADASLARETDAHGRSAFVLAFVHGHEELAGVVRTAGIELDVVEAVLAEDWARFDALVEAEPERMHRAHPIGGTPLYAAALIGSLEGWRLRAAGCLSDAAPEHGSGYTPARGALEAPHPAWARIGLTEITSNGGDVNAPQRGGSSVLHAAVARRDEALVRLAIRKGANPAARDERDRTPLALAMAIEWDEGVTLLQDERTLPRDHRASRFALDANRKPIVRPDLSDVPRATQARVTGNSHGNLKGVRELVEPDPRLVFSISTDDELAIEACAHTGAAHIIRFHLDHGAPLSLPTAVALGDLDSVKYWFARDPLLVHERGAHDFPVMWYAALGVGGVEMAELLVHSGVDVDQESMGATALHWCAMRDRTEVARFLLAKGANPEAEGHRFGRVGRTPLELARESESTGVAKALEEAGAKR